MKRNLSDAEFIDGVRDAIRYGGAPFATVEDVAEHFDCSKPTVLARMDTIEESEIIVRKIGQAFMFTLPDSYTNPP